MKGVLVSPGEDRTRCMGTNREQKLKQENSKQVLRWQDSGFDGFFEMKRQQVAMFCCCPLTENDHESHFYRLDFCPGDEAPGARPPGLCILQSQPLSPGLGQGN